MSAPTNNSMILRWIMWFALYLVAGCAGVVAIRLYRGEPIGAEAFIERLPVLLIAAALLTGFQVMRDLRRTR